MRSRRTPLLALMVSLVLIWGSPDVLTAPPIAKADGPRRPEIRKLGSLDLDMVEATPVVFKDHLYRFEYVRKDYKPNTTGDSYFRFIDVETGKATPAFAHGYDLGCAVAEGGSMWAFGVDQWDGTKIVGFRSTDLNKWEQHPALELPGWGLFNTSVCKAGDRYVMAIEVGRPPEVVGVPFTGRFAESRDLKSWKLLPEDRVFTKERYSACPSIRFLDGLFYMTYLEARPGPTYETHIVRSKDLIRWESSPLNPVLIASDQDKRIANPKMTEEQRRKVAGAVDRNNSDMDFREFRGRTVIFYSWGNQQGTEFLAEAVYDGSLASFLRGFFPKITRAGTRAVGVGAGAGVVTAHGDGLHGYIGFGHEKLPAGSAYSAGMGFYAAVWPLADRPLSHFQIGLPSAWIMPDNSDNQDRPLAPEGTVARRWPERGPTWSSVFQTVEGGLGYWAGNHFRYGPPKFSMNATPQCYDYEVGSPGWAFFHGNAPLPDDRLGIAQLSNRLLIPPDALPFQGRPNGEFLGYTWMALPFTDPTTGDPPTGDQSWTCFLNSANFKGPIAYYIPETWSKIGKLFRYPFLHGRGLDARPGLMGGGAMEINTVPRFEAADAEGTVYSKLPALRFPVDEQGRAYLVQDVTYYAKSALSDAFRAWRLGGPACSGRFDDRGAWKPKLTTHSTRYDQRGKKIVGVERVFDTRIFEGNVWGVQWFPGDVAPRGMFPQYYKHVGDERVVVAESRVPAETGLQKRDFDLARPGAPYTSPNRGAWIKPGPSRGPFSARLADGSVVTYSWYRFVDQPSFQQYAWSDEKKANLQRFVERIHATWPIDRDYMNPPGRGRLVSLDPALIVTPPTGLEVGYVPIVTRQEKR